VKGERYHLAGVGGAGMSALAQVLLAEGAAVSGSDRSHDAGLRLEVLRRLQRAGVRLVPQDGGGVSRGLSAVVVSTAVEAENADVRAAVRLEVPVVHRAALLARLAEGKRVVAVAGTSGKSTVTAMTGWILERAGLDPVVVNGAPVPHWEGPAAVGNARCGGKGPWVIEADESDRSLLRFRPQYAVITNASPDHFGLAETRRLFRAFAGRVTGAVVDNARGRALPLCFAPEVSARGSRFAWGGADFSLGLPGRHNAENALLAAMLCERMGVAPAVSAEALRAFRGVRRRLERAGRARGVTVIDDYAHNPAKIRAAWCATAPHYARALAIWRPHGYGPLAAMMDDLCAAFRELARPSDRLWILPVYDAGGTADRGVRAATLVARLRGAGVRARNARDYAQLEERIAGEAREGDLVLSMGARDPELPAFARRLARRIGGRRSARRTPGPART